MERKEEMKIYNKKFKEDKKLASEYEKEFLTEEECETIVEYIFGNSSEYIKNLYKAYKYGLES